MFNLYTLENSITRHLTTAQVPGLALAIVRDQELLYARGFGTTSVEDGGMPVTPATLYRIGATTQALTGTAILRMSERGLLDLDTPIKAYVNSLRLYEARAIERITLRMLLSHTAGLPTELAETNRERVSSLARCVFEELPRYPLIAEPGALFSYSNPGILLAGYIAEVVYGKPFATVMRELIFEPLEMQRTTFDPLVALTYPCAQAHIVRENGLLAVEHSFADNPAGYPAGYALSTALDMSNFALMHLNGGSFRGQSFLSPSSINAMHSPHTQLFTLKERAYGLTLSLDSYQGRQVVGHDGSISSFGCLFALLPQERIGVTLLYNRPELDGAGILHGVFDRLLEGTKTAPRLSVSTRNKGGSRKDRQRWPRYIGTYLSSYIGLVEITIVKGQLLLCFNDERIQLQRYRQDLYIGRFEEQGDETGILSVGFVLNDEGDAQYLILNPYGDDSVSHLLECKRVRLPDSQDKGQASDSDGVSGELWQEYLGTYENEELGAYTVAIEKGQLLLDAHDLDERAVCTVVGAHQFACKWGLFQFEIDDTNRVSRMVHRGHMVTLQRVQSELVTGCHM